MISQQSTWQTVKTVVSEANVVCESDCKQISAAQAFQRLGLEQIPCRVRKANQNTLKMHMM